MAENLLPMGADPSMVFFSGSSSGAYMSTTMSLIHSKTIKGAGINQGSLLPLNYPTAVEDDSGFKTYADWLV